VLFTYAEDLMSHCPFCYHTLTAEDLQYSICPYCYPEIRDKEAIDLRETGVVKNIVREKMMDLTGELRDEDKVWSRDGLGPREDCSHEPDLYPGFIIKGEIGRGGFGSVLLAHDAGARRDVAMKTFSVDCTSSERSDTKERFLDEAYITAQLQHPGIIPIYLIEKDAEGRYFYTMRPVEGASLQTIVQKLKDGDSHYIHNYPLRSLIKVLVSVCQTVRFAHERGVIHRDLKPGNIIVGDYGEVLVIDWGLAKVLGDPERAARENVSVGPGPYTSVWGRYKREITSLRTGSESSFVQTLDGQVMGTPFYMSPEQVRGKVEEIDFQSDIWSLGVILYECATLRLPFTGNDLNTLLTRILREHPVEPLEANPHHRVPPELSTLIMKCLKKDKSERTSRVQDIVRGLELWLEGVAPWDMVLDFDFETMPVGPVENLLGTGGTWQIKDGLLHGVDHGNVLTTCDFPGDVRVEVVARLEENDRGFIAAQLCAPGPEDKFVYKGYIASFFPGETPLIRLFKDGHEMVCQAVSHGDRAYHRVVAEKIGTDVHLSLDDIELLHYRDYFPPAGLRHGLFCQGSGLRVKRLRILRRGSGIKVSCLDVPRAFIERGLLSEGTQLYSQIATDHPGREEGFEALFQLGLCKLEQARLLDRDRERTQYAAHIQELRDIFMKLEKSFFAPLGVLGLSLVHELEGNVEGEIDELLRALRDYPDYDTLPHIIERFRIRVLIYPQTGEAVPSLEQGIERVMLSHKSSAHNPCPLRGLPLRGLQLSEKIRDINALQGMTLEWLDLSRTTVEDLQPLAAMGLQSLSLPPSVSDIGLLVDIKLSALDLSQTKVENLGPLAGMPLKTLVLPDTVCSIEPLRGSILEHLDLSRTEVVDLSALEGIPLRFILLPEQITSVNGLQGSSLDFLRIPAGVRAIDGLQGMNLRGLDLSASAVTDLSPLRGMDLLFLALPEKISDLGPLESMPLQTIDLYRTRVSDLRPLLTLPQLKRVNVCPEKLETGWHTIIRDLPGLELLGTDEWFSPQLPCTVLEMDRAGQVLNGHEPPSGPLPDLLHSVNSLGSTFRWVPPGIFLMGSPLHEAGRRSDEEQHFVALRSGFYIAANPVTVAEFELFVSATDHKTTAEIEGGAIGMKGRQWSRIAGLDWRHPGFQQSDAQPVVCVSWDDAHAFCRWLSEREGCAYGLATEAEWEYACRAGTAGPFANPIDDMGWFDENSHNRTHETGRKTKNPWGLADFQGNVWEWCEDWYGPYAAGFEVDQSGPQHGDARVIRGGGWSSTRSNCRSASRFSSPPVYCVSDLGFRIVRKVRSDELV